jgi:D-alanyl-D-alanine carboxypeptidase/Putative peptidoglycan binding domain
VVTVRVFGASIQFARLGANRLLRAAIRAYDVDYGVYRIESYNCRKVTGGTSRSAHSWPVAVDINPNTNPYSSKGTLITDMPRAFVDCFKAEGFGWGGEWRHPKDAMHFSLAPNEKGKPHPEPFDTRLQQRANQKWKAKHGGKDPGLAAKPRTKKKGIQPPPFGGVVLSFEGWNVARKPQPAVRTFQLRLKERGWAIATDGNFPKAVERVVRAFQREKELPITGKVDAATWKAIWRAPIT